MLFIHHVVGVCIVTYGDKDLIPSRDHSFIYLFIHIFILWVTLGFQCILEKNVSMHCTCKSCNSVRSLALSADRHWLSGLDADSLLSKQETKFDRCFSYLKRIDRNTGVSKSKNLINYSVYTVCCTDCIYLSWTNQWSNLTIDIAFNSKLNASFFLNSSYFCQRESRFSKELCLSFASSMLCS